MKRCTVFVSITPYPKMTRNSMKNGHLEIFKEFGGSFEKMSDAFKATICYF